MEETYKIIKNAPAKMQEMLKSVLEYNSWHVKNGKQRKLLEKILFAMSIIDRKFFVENEDEAYIDTALSIGQGQTISQPSTVARMLLLAEIEEGDNVLEIGAGSGWNASLISFLVYPSKVLSIDRINALVEKASLNLKKLKNYLKQKKPYEFNKLEINFSAQNILDLKKSRKFDKIIFTAGILRQEQEKKIEKIADSLLVSEGILILPRVSGQIIIFKKGKVLEKQETKEEYVFVPLLEGVD